MVVRGKVAEAVMGETTGGQEPTAGIRVSDAERDAAVERLSVAAGDGRLTLGEFSQRMELATAARTRADLDRVVADLPADAATAGSVVTSGASGPPSWHVSLVGGTRVTVPPGIRVEASGFSLIGGTRIEGGPEPGPGAPTVRIRAFSLVGGFRIQRSGLPGRSPATAAPAAGNGGADSSALTPEPQPGAADERLALIRKRTTRDLQAITL